MNGESKPPASTGWANLKYAIGFAGLIMVYGVALCLFSWNNLANTWGVIAAIVYVPASWLLKTVAPPGASNSPLFPITILVVQWLIWTVVIYMLRSVLIRFRCLRETSFDHHPLLRLACYGVLICGLLLARSWPPLWLEHRQHRKKVAEIVAKHGGWESLRKASVEVFRMSKTNSWINPYKDPVPPLIRALPLRELEARTVGKGGPMVYLQMFGFHSTGHRPQARYTLLVMIQPVPENFIPTWDHDVSNPQINKLANGIYEVYGRKGKPITLDEVPALFFLVLLLGLIGFKFWWVR